LNIYASLFTSQQAYCVKKDPWIRSNDHTYIQRKTKILPLQVEVITKRFALICCQW